MVVFELDATRKICFSFDPSHFCMHGERKNHHPAGITNAERLGEHQFSVLAESIDSGQVNPINSEVQSRSNLGLTKFQSFWSRSNDSRGCLGCCTTTSPIISVDVPSKGTIQGQAVKKPSISEDFWSTSTCEMDNSTVQSQRSVLSLGTSNRTDPTSGTSSTNNPTEFVNHGLLLWNQTRQQWIGNKRSENKAQQDREPKLSWNATYDSLLGTNKPFLQSIPLSEMVDFLVDVWEQEGMYD